MMVSVKRDIEVVVSDVRTETPDIKRFTLVPRHGGELPEFLPGAHIDVEPLPGLIRQYSLVNDPANRGRYEIGVKREAAGRGGSSTMHTAVREGSTLKISAPKNNFTLHETTGRRILLAGGIGVTPLLSMAAALERQQAPFQIHYFVRSGDDLAFRDLFSESLWKTKAMLHLGLVPPALNEVLGDILARPGDGDQIYMCGPQPFMEAIRTVAAQAGWAETSVYSELFSAPPPSIPMEGAEFIVRLNSSGAEFRVPPGKSIIEVLRDGGIEIETSCEQGICGTCVTRCLEGEPDHADSYLTDDEHEKERLFAPCVSRALSKFLVIDL